MQEHPRSPTIDSVSESRVNALASLGFTQRQREFLVTVMVHAGCFLERQYCGFTRTVRGKVAQRWILTVSKLQKRFDAITVNAEELISEAERAYQYGDQAAAGGAVRDAARHDLPCFPGQQDPKS